MVLNELPLSSARYDCVIAGGGPVGLTAALYCARQGLRTLVVERRTEIPEGSRAIGISPPSLEILSELGLAEEFIGKGVGIQKVKVFGRSKLLGRVDFSDIPSDYPYILSLPQKRTEEILRRAAEGEANIDLLYGWTARSFAPETETADGRSAPADGYAQLELLAEGDSGPYSADVRARLNLPADDGAAANGGGESVAASPDGGTTGPAGEVSRGVISAPLFLACDGAASNLRGSLGLGFSGKFYRSSFLMGDFPDATDFGGEARLFFTPDGAVESFPLSDGSRRWIVQTSEYRDVPDPRFIADAVSQRTGLKLAGLPTWLSPFRVRRNIIERFWLKRGSSHVVFMGDAAHLMSPIGGQGMNTGFADVQFLSPLLKDLARAGGSAAAGRGEGTGSGDSTVVCAGAEAGRSDPDADSAGHSIPGLRGAAGGSVSPLAVRLRRWEKMRRRAFNVAASRAARSMGLGTVRGRAGSAIRNMVLWYMINGLPARKLPIDYAMLSIPHRNLTPDVEL